MKKIIKLNTNKEVATIIIDINIIVSLGVQNFLFLTSSFRFLMIIYGL